MSKKVTNSDIDIGLSALCMHAPAGYEMTQSDIASVCNCSRNAIYLIEKRALEKARKHACRLGITDLLED